MSLVPGLDLSTLAGYGAYMGRLKNNKSLRKSSRRLDLEGMATCGSDTYPINERARHILVVTGGKFLKEPFTLLRFIG